MCPSCRAFVEDGASQCPYCEQQLGPRVIDQRHPADVAGGLIPHARFTTMMILIVNSALFAATIVYGMNQGNESSVLGLSGPVLFQFGAKWSPAVFAGQWWRLVTAGFLHGGLLHIAMNTWALMDLGAQVEEIYGSSRLLVFYFIATVSGFLASTFWSASLSVGASAGIFGLIGAMIAIGVRHNTALGSAIRGLYIRWAMYGLLFGLLPGLAIDNAAHLGGLAAGFIAAYLAGEPGRPGSTMEKFWSATAGLTLIVTAYCFFKMFLWFNTTQG